MPGLARGLILPVSGLFWLLLGFWVPGGSERFYLLVPPHLLPSACVGVALPLEPVVRPSLKGSQCVDSGRVRREIVRRCGLSDRRWSYHSRLVHSRKAGLTTVSGHLPRAGRQPFHVRSLP